jgi:hypothetical protein
MTSKLMMALGLVTALTACTKTLTPEQQAQAAKDNAEVDSIAAVITPEVQKMALALDSVGKAMVADNSDPHGNIGAINAAQMAVFKPMADEFSRHHPSVMLKPTFTGDRMGEGTRESFSVGVEAVTVISGQSRTVTSMALLGPYNQ